MVGLLSGLVVVGPNAGLTARALDPGRGAMGVAATLVLGTVGSFPGGFRGDGVSRTPNDERAPESAEVARSDFGVILPLRAYHAVARRRICR